MKDKLLDYFNEFVEKRVSELFIELKNNSPEYVERLKEIENIEEKLIENLSEKNRTFFNDYENHMNFEIGLTREFSYKKGFEDGIRVSQIFDQLRSKDCKELASNQ